MRTNTSSASSPSAVISISIEPRPRSDAAPDDDAGSMRNRLVEVSTPPPPRAPPPTLPFFLPLPYFAPSNMTVMPPRADRGDDSADRKIGIQSMMEMLLLDEC